MLSVLGENQCKETESQGLTGVDAKAQLDSDDKYHPKLQFAVIMKNIGNLTPAKEPKGKKKRTEKDKCVEWKINGIKNQCHNETFQEG